MAAPDPDSFSRLTLSQDPSPPSSTAMLEGSILGERYRLLRRLGSGTVGHVYEAERLEAGGDRVAIKVMRPLFASQPEQVRRFRREARAASLLQHAHAVRVIELAEDPARSTFFIVMELLSGETLGAWLARQRTPPSITHTVALLLPLLDALQAAHAVGIVHRDLKPDNIFLTLSDENHRGLKVVDFGLAHVPDPDDRSTLTRPEHVGGTPHYMSPEQCRSLQVGPAADLYAVGCLLTELLQLRPPFEGEAVEILAHQMLFPPPPLARPAASPPVPPALERLRLDLLAKDPAQRPDAEEVRQRLLEVLSPPVSSPPSTPLGAPPAAPSVPPAVVPGPAPSQGSTPPPDDPPTRDSAAPGTMSARVSGVWKKWFGRRS